MATIPRHIMALIPIHTMVLIPIHIKVLKHTTTRHTMAINHTITIHPTTRINYESINFTKQYYHNYQLKESQHH